MIKCLSSLDECREMFADMSVSCDCCELLWGYDELIIQPQMAIRGYLTDIDESGEFETDVYVENCSALGKCPICQTAVVDFNW